MSVRIINGDCMEVLDKLEAESIHTIITSPPYFGLRDYGVDGQVGMEDSPTEYIAKLVEIFHKVKRVLRNDGTLWINIGDCYATTKEGNTNGMNGKVKQKNGINNNKQKRKTPDGLKRKDLIGIPFMLAFALRDDGWYLRQDIIWNKPNCMPESVTDRCTKSHEYIFLLSKSEHYYFDCDSIKEQAKPDNSIRNRDETKLNNTPGRTRMAGLTTNHYEMKNKRSVWTVPTKPYKGSHFAVFPKDLIYPCILAGCPIQGTVLDPFAGSGTVGECAEENGRNSVLIELNPEYCKLIRKRTEQIGLFTSI